MTSRALPEQDHRLGRRLRLLRWLAAVDAVLLIALIAAAVTNTRSLVHVLGPVHGVNYLVLLVTAGTAALDGVWGWWFPLLILVTGGPIGTLIGDRVLRHRLSIDE